MSELKGQIATLERALKSPALPDKLRGEMEDKLDNLKIERAAATKKKARPPAKPKAAAKPARPRARQSSEDSKATESRYKKRRARSIQEGVRKPGPSAPTKPTPTKPTPAKPPTPLKSGSNEEAVSEIQQLLSRVGTKLGQISSTDEARLRTSVKADLLRDKAFIAGIKKDLRKEVKREILADIKKLKKGGKTARGSKK